MPKLFPKADSHNITLCVTGKSRYSFSALAVGHITDSSCVMGINGTSQCFPLYWYEKVSKNPPAIESETKVEYMRRDAISDYIVDRAIALYARDITKEDIFYYIYGMLHSAMYQQRFAENLAREQPRIPKVRTSTDFWAFSRAGRKLGDLHVNYETVPEFDGASVEGPNEPKPTHYRVEKMKYGKQQDKNKDKTVIHYNKHFTIRKIPLDAYDYVINGRSAIESVMKYQSVTTDNASGITKDANEYAIETMNDPRYPLSLLLRVITVSLETMKIVNSLPTLDVAG